MRVRRRRASECKLRFAHYNLILYVDTFSGQLKSASEHSRKVYKSQGASQQAPQELFASARLFELSDRRSVSRSPSLQLFT